MFTAFVKWKTSSDSLSSAICHIAIELQLVLFIKDDTKRIQSFMYWFIIQINDCSIDIIFSPFSDRLCPSAMLLNCLTYLPNLNTWKSRIIRLKERFNPTWKGVHSLVCSGHVPQGKIICISSWLDVQMQKDVLLLRRMWGSIVSLHYPTLVHLLLDMGNRSDLVKGVGLSLNSFVQQDEPTFPPIELLWANRFLLCLSFSLEQLILEKGLKGPGWLDIVGASKLLFICLLLILRKHRAPVLFALVK